MSAAPRLSLVVPVFNGAEHLPRFLAGLRAQTLQEAEFILVDDGSTDASAAMLATFAANDSRASIVRQANAGPSQARNHGVSRARAPIVSFADADDDVHPEFCEALERRLREERLDVAYCNGRRIDAHGIPHARPLIRTRADGEVSSGADWIASAVARDDFVHAPWLLACTAPLARRTPFPVGIIHEDIPWTCELLLGAPRVGFIARELYGYRSTPHSLMREPSVGARQRRIDGYFEVVRLLLAMAARADVPANARCALRRHAADQAPNVFRFARLLPGTRERLSVRARAGRMHLPALMWREARSLAERRRAARACISSLAARIALAGARETSGEPR